jgi:LysM repeat protein
MAGRSPLRFLAPIALVACAVALYTVVDDARTGGRDSTSQTPSPSSTPSGSKPAATKKAKRKRKVYVVKSGDTASGIAEKTGVTVDTMKKLNKKFDPQTLAPGQRIRLSE